MRLPAPLALLVAAGLLLLAAPPAGAAIAYAPCSRGSALQCGSLDVPLDRSGAVPGTRAARRRAPRRAVEPDEHRRASALAGGPGQAALPLISDFADAAGAGARHARPADVRPARHRRLEPAALLAAAARDADGGGHALRGRASAPRRGHYTTAASVEDIEALRAESGYEKLVIYGVSYGTKVALDYAARHPDRVAGARSWTPSCCPRGPTRCSARRSRRCAACSPSCAPATSATASPATPTGDLASRVRSLATRPLRGLLTSARGVRQRVDDRPPRPLRRHARPATSTRRCAPSCRAR